MKLLLLLALITLTFHSQARELPALKKIESNKVIFQSKQVREVRSLGMFKTRVVARWGVHVYQVVDAYFKCSTLRCRFDSYKTRDFYQSCELKNTQMRCQKRISPDGGSAPDSVGYWERHPDGSFERRVDNDYDEPVRGDDSWETGGVVLF